MLLYRFSVSTPLDKPTFLHLPAPYRTTIARNLLGFHEDRLVYYNPIATVTNYIYHIVVPTSLRHVLLNLINATPTAGHMGEYKTLYRIELRFLWLRLRLNVSDRLRLADKN